jgi:hypothetical protein
MKYIDSKRNPLLCVLMLILAGSIAVNASAMVSEKCKKGLEPLRAEIKLNSGSDERVASLLRYAVTQCISDDAAKGKNRRGFKGLG